MSELLHVVIKDHENSGYVWDSFFCRPGLLREIVKGLQLAGNP